MVKHVMFASLVGGALAITQGVVVEEVQYQDQSYYKIQRADGKIRVAPVADCSEFVA